MTLKPDKPDILPCPFCGSDGAFETSFSGGPYVLCDGCGAATMFASNEAEALAAWNTRQQSTPRPTPDPEAVERVARAIKAAAGYRINGQLARKYGVSKDTIGQIRRGKAWRHVLPARHPYRGGAL